MPGLAEWACVPDSGTSTGIEARAQVRWGSLVRWEGTAGGKAMGRQAPAGLFLTPSDPSLSYRSAHLPLN